MLEKVLMDVGGALEPTQVPVVLLQDLYYLELHYHKNHDNHLFNYWMK